MQRTSAAPAFVYSVGDIVYFNADPSEYEPQFYEAYGHLAAPIVAIPGNHDGDTTDNPSRTPLDTFMANFCTSRPAIPPADPHLEFGRHTQTQPYCDWTLELQAVTITGVYTNVPSGGVLAPSQIEWLTGELKDAPTDRPLIVALHHPPYSVDALHGGSQHMGDALDGAFQAANRAPELVLSGHIHDYQRFTRTLGEWTIPYLVIGNSGYHKPPPAGERCEAGRGGRRWGRPRLRRREPVRLPGADRLRRQDLRLLHRRHPRDDARRLRRDGDLREGHLLTGRD
jgi:predicted MPP superfamily phosphohydrolase